jgi:hypothetical protein
MLTVHYWLLQIIKQENIQRNEYDTVIMRRKFLNRTEIEGTDVEQNIGKYVGTDCVTKIVKMDIL